MIGVMSKDVPWRRVMMKNSLRNTGPEENYVGNLFSLVLVA
jgi:hypothetical protein